MITIYNEPFSQVLESLIGLYRAYYELISKDDRYAGKVAVFIVADGVEPLSKEFLDSCQAAGIFDHSMLEPSLYMG